MLSVMDRCDLCKPGKNGSVSALTIEIKYLNYVPKMSPSRRGNFESSGKPGMLELQLDHGFAREDASSKKSAIGSCSQAKSPTSAQPFALHAVGLPVDLPRRPGRRRLGLPATVPETSTPTLSAPTLAGRPIETGGGRKGVARTSFASLSTAVEGTTVSVRSARSGAQPGVSPAVGRAGRTSLLTRGRLALRLAVAGERGVSVMRGRDEHL